ncbi:MAG: acyltransferase family protein [Euryarchaeota archaeon]|nr:acyltransferase family protein [Euryarchaeota archaeon]
MQQRHNNNFDFLRFFAASSIIISHSFALTLGYSKISMYDPSLLFGQLGLATLLVISGYLISQSWENKPELFRFFWKRSVRIIPGLTISILFVMVALYRTTCNQLKPRKLYRKPALTCHMEYISIL